MTAHDQLVKKVEQFLNKAGFVTDTYIELELNENGVPKKYEYDVCAKYEEILIIVECKAGSNTELKNLILEWKSKRDKFDQFEKKVINSSKKKITTSLLNEVETSNVLFVVNNFEPTETNYTHLDSEDMGIWDNTDLDFYNITINALGEWTKYEIMTDLNIQPEETKKTINLPGIQIKQPASKCYLISMEPSHLLKIAYVFRRSSRAKGAYQRIIKKNRLNEMGEFLKKSRSLLPNNIILGFESKVKISPIKNEVVELTIPMEYCSAWVIDGQHRLFGFTRTKYKEIEKKFKIPVVAFTDLPDRDQAHMFIDINNNQKKMDKTLLSDLMTELKDLNEPMTWPSLLVKELNKNGPWKNKIKILEVEQRKPINLYSFGRYGLMQRLLKPRLKYGKIIKYEGPLYKYAKFDIKKSFDGEKNQSAFRKQLKLLQDYFVVIQKIVYDKNKQKNMWENSRKYGLTKATGVTAMLLVLCKILETGKTFDQLKIGKFMLPIKNVDFSKEKIKQFGRGYDSYNQLANEIISKLNRKNTVQLEKF